MINEGKKLIKNQLADCEEDIDLALILGMGWPPFLGGPMSYAKSLGLSKLKSAMEELARRHGERFQPHF